MNAKGYFLYTVMLFTFLISLNILTVLLKNLTFQLMRFKIFGEILSAIKIIISTVCIILLEFIYVDKSFNFISITIALGIYLFCNRISTSKGFQNSLCLFLRPVMKLRDKRKKIRKDYNTVDK